MTKYAFLTKDLLQKDYDELGSLSEVARKYDMPTGSIKTISRRLDIKTDKPGGKRKYTVNENIFSVDSEICFYIAGFMAADGNIFFSKQYDTSAFILHLARKDKAHLIKTKEAMQFTGKVKDYSHFNKEYQEMHHSSCLQIYCSKKIVEDIGEKFNVVPQKTFTYTFPDKITDHKLVRHFIRGYFDGDGCIYTDKRDNSICFELLGTKSFLESVYKILERDCDLKANVSIAKTKNIYRLRFSAKIIINKLSNYLYGDSTFHLDRKRDIIKHLLV